jgi:hypothetical protein
MRSLAPRPGIAAALLAVAMPAPAAACDGWGVPFRNGSSTLSRRAERGLSRFLVVVASDQLERTAADYRTHPFHYRVTGYPDGRGPPNAFLARRRAQVVRAKLIQLGLPAAKIAIGETPGERSPEDDVVIAFGTPGMMCGGG